jgi:dTDP-glucose 4,6-dehydratase
MADTIFLVGAAGFIGCNFVKKLAVPHNDINFVIIDKLTYAGHMFNIEEELEHDHIGFEKADIVDSTVVSQLFEKYQPDAIINFAAESHVDRSIENPNVFLETNVMGTMNLLNNALKLHKKNKFTRFLQVSTDEVYGELTHDEEPFSEQTPIKPNSPYSASKASADHLVHAYHHTYGLDTVITRCSNNYGPYQNPEKLIPVMIDKATKNEKLPVYGKGENVRDWIYVDDHNHGIWNAFERGNTGSIYNFGGNSEYKNIDLVKKILELLGKDEDLISFVTDRLGHDFRYAINFEKAATELGWTPKVEFNQGMIQTIDWYLGNKDWIEKVQKKWES